MGGCDGCKYEKQPSSCYPCSQCIRNPNDIFDEYTPNEGNVARVESLEEEKS